MYVLSVARKLASRNSIRWTTALRTACKSGRRMQDRAGGQLGLAAAWFPTCDSSRSGFSSVRNEAACSTNISRITSSSSSSSSLAALSTLRRITAGSTLPGAAGAARVPGQRRGGTRKRTAVRLASNERVAKRPGTPTRRPSRKPIVHHGCRLGKLCASDQDQWKSVMHEKLRCCNASLLLAAPLKEATGQVKGVACAGADGGGGLAAAGGCPGGSTAD